MMKVLAVLFLALSLSLSGNLLHGQTSGDTAKASPPFGMPESSAYYLFYSSFQNNNYKKALKFGRWILINMPEKIKKSPTYDLSTNLDRFITIYSTLADSTTNLTKKDAYIDTVSQIYNKVFQKFGKDDISYYRWHLNRGRFYQKYSDFIDNAKAKTTQQYLKAYKLHPDSMTTGRAYYLKVLLRNLMQKGTPQSKKQARAIVKKERKYADSSLNDYLDKVQTGLFKNQKDRIAFLEKKVKANPKDEKDLKTLRKLYSQQGNTAKVQEVNKKLFKLDPSYNNATSLANVAIQNNNYKKAVIYLKAAVDKTDNPSNLKIINLNLARAYLHLGQLQEARNYAYKASHADPNWGRPDIVIADIYAHAVKKCTANRKLTRNDKAVYWLVVDYLNKAKNVDPSVSKIANGRLQLYRSYTPTKQDIFFQQGWKKGQTIKIDGSLNPCYSWINETTTIR